MTSNQLVVKRWTWDKTLSEMAILRHMEMEGLETQRWKNEPGTKYEAHVHDYDKVILIMRGSITFRLPKTGEEVSLNPGDKLELPAGLSHEAVVGPMGVVCLEGHRKVTV